MMKNSGAADRTGSRKRRAGAVRIGAMATSAIAGAAAAVALMTVAPASTRIDIDTFRQLDLFGEVFERVHLDYVTDVDDGELVEGAINGMLATLDPHSSYIPPDTYEDVRVQTTGEYGGLGMEVTMENGLIKVVAPIDDTPAQRAGMQPGDFITALDGKPVRGMTLDEALEIMKGEPNTDITITVAREGESQTFDVPLTRAVIVLKSVRHRIEDEDIGYIRISTFSEQTMRGVEEAFDSFRDELGDRLAGVIIDLRDDPGGLLDQAISVSDAFLDSGEIVSTRGRNPRDNRRYNARRGDLAEGLEMVVLINEGSASASEIVAGALKDHERATLVGVRTFGKGSVQTVLPLQGGVNGALRLTTARYYTPSGVSIQAKGIEPDVEVLDPRRAGRRRFTEADLRNALDVPEDETEPEADEDAPQDILDELGARAEEEEEFPEYTEEELEALGDVQLKRAIAILRGEDPIGQSAQLVQDE